MNARTRAAAADLLGAFLADDAHYRASAAHYGDGGRPALERALDLFLAHPEIGFVWLAFAADGHCRRRLRGVPRHLDVARRARRQARRRHHSRRLAGAWRRHGDARRACGMHLREGGVARIDTACHRDNAGAWRFYERLGFRPLDEERLALLPERRAP